MKRPIPQYVDEMIDGAVSRLENLRTPDTISFAFITDTHSCIDYTERALYAISKINEQHKIAFTCMGGDYLCNNSSTSRENAVAQHREFRDAVENLGQNPPTVIIKGNHDDNPFGEIKNIVPQNELYNLLFEHNAFLSGGDPTEAYGYYDMPELKLRAIYLNSSDRRYETDSDGTVIDVETGGYGNKQLNWFAHDALILPDNDWSVVIFAHIMPIATQIMLDRPFGGEALWNILLSFKNGGKYSAYEDRNGESYEVSCDFSKNGKGNVIAFVTGHEHVDRTCMADGIRIITVLSAASDNFCTGVSGNGRVQYKTRGSGEESAFSVFVIDRKTHVISQIRCGAGDDYSVSF